MTDSLVKHGNFTISIDFSYDKTIFESIRGRKGDFEIIRDNIQYLIDKSKNKKDILIEMHDISSFKKKDPKWRKKFIETFEQLPSNSVIYRREFHNFGGFIRTDAEKGNYHLCPYPWTQMAITHEGNVVACCRDTDGMTILGNVFEQKIEDIWLGKKYQFLRMALKKKQPELIEACKDCDMPWNTSNEKFRLSYLFRKLFER